MSYWKFFGLSRFITMIEVVPSNERPMDICCDNSDTINIASEPGSSEKRQTFPKKGSIV